MVGVRGVKCCQHVCKRVVCVLHTQEDEGNRAVCPVSPQRGGGGAESPSAQMRSLRYVFDLRTV